jgi:hypothetical protein
VTDRIDFGGRPWHAIPRDALRDPRLSLKGRGALVTLLSHEEGWVRSAIATLMREAQCGRDAAKAAMAELREAGYAELLTERDLEGHLRRHYVIFAESRSPAPRTSGSLGDGKPDRRETRPTGNPADEVEAPDVEALDVREARARAAPKPAPSRKRDEIHDALSEIEGADPNQLTKRHAAGIGVAAAEIRTATPDVSAGEIHRRAGVYKRLHPEWELTANALAKHWAAVSGVRAVPNRAPREDADGALIDEMKRARGIGG